MEIGYKLIAEANGPEELVRQTVEAEQAGFAFVEISDHFHPWLPEQGHSPFAFSVLAAAAMRTERIRLATGVTCPIMRYHPAIVAQAAATTALLADGRFTLGIGAGERLNEHVIGGGWPSVRIRHEMLREALEIIRLLWSGGSHSYAGNHLTLEDARVWDLPEVAPEIAVAISGPKSAAIAAELGDAIFATEPDAGADVEAYAQTRACTGRQVRRGAARLRARRAGRRGVRTHRLFRFGALGWKVMSDLPNVVNFDAATAFVTPDDIRGQFGCGRDPARFLEVAQQFVDAGFDRLALVNAGTDVDGFFTFFAQELAEPLRALTPAG